MYFVYKNARIVNEVHLVSPVSQKRLVLHTVQTEAALCVYPFTINARADWRAATSRYAFQRC